MATPASFTSFSPSAIVSSSSSTSYRSSLPAGIISGQWSQASTSSMIRRRPPSFNQPNLMENNDTPREPMPPPESAAEQAPEPAAEQAPEPTDTPPLHPLRESFRKAIGTSDQLTAQQQI